MPNHKPDDCTDQGGRMKKITPEDIFLREIGEIRQRLDRIIADYMAARPLEGAAERKPVELIDPRNGKPFNGRNGNGNGSIR